MARWVNIGKVPDFPQGELRSVDADGTTLIVSRDGEAFCAARNRLPHLGFPLHKGPAGVNTTYPVVVTGDDVLVEL